MLLNIWYSISRLFIFIILGIFSWGVGEVIGIFTAGGFKWEYGFIINKLKFIFNKVIMVYWFFLYLVLIISLLCFVGLNIYYLVMTPWAGSLFSFMVYIFWSGVLFLCLVVRIGQILGMALYSIFNNCQFKV